MYGPGYEAIVTQYLYSNQSVTRPRAPAGSNTGIDMEIEDGREMVCGGKGDLQQLAVLHEQYLNQC